MKRYFLLLTMFLAVVACVEPENNKNNPDDPQPGDNYTPDITKYGEFKLADGVIFIDDMMDDFVTLDNGSVVISNVGATTKASAELSCFPNNLVPEEGDVIFIPLTDKFPEGFMGRVVSSEGKGKGKELHLETEEVSLLDVFAELNVKIENFDVGALVEEVEDNDGNVYSTETVDPDVWDSVGNKEDQENEGSVMTRAGGKDNASKKISIKTPEFEGYLLAQLGVDINLNIGLGKITYTVTSSQKIGLHLGADFKLVEVECELPILKAKPIPIPFGNLLAFKPQLVISSGFTLSGDVSLKAGLDILAVNESTTISNATGQVTRKTEQIGKVPSFKWNVDFIEMDLRFGIYFASAIEYTTVVKDMFAVGVEARASFETATNVVVSSNDESLLETNQTINFEPSLSISAYAKWRKPFLKEPEVFKSAPLIKTGTPISVNLLPPFTNLKKTEEKDAIAVTGSIKPQSYVSSREQGYVLFKKGDSTPIEYKPCNENPNPVTPVTSAPAEEPKPIETEVKFTGLAKPEEYEVKAYVVAEDGKYYYKPISTVVRKISFFMDASHEKDYEFLYNEKNNKLSKFTQQSEPIEYNSPTIFNVSDDMSSIICEHEDAKIDISNILWNTDGNITNMHFHVNGESSCTGDIEILYNDEHQLVEIVLNGYLNGTFSQGNISENLLFVYEDNIVREISYQSKGIEQFLLNYKILFLNHSLSNVNGQFDVISLQMMHSFSGYLFGDIIPGLAVSGHLGKYSFCFPSGAVFSGRDLGSSNLTFQNECDDSGILVLSSYHDTYDEGTQVKAEYYYY